MKELLEQFPIVCLLGPRQCGKTTFIKQELPGWKYFDLEKPAHAVQVEEDPEAVLARNKSKIVFDEAQQIPSLFPVLRSYVDELQDAEGSIVLLGSASPQLIQGVSESLAGRVGFIDMTPFLLDEVHDERGLWLRGGFPRAYMEEDRARRLSWYEAYTRTFIERDLQLYGIEVNSSQMRKLWAMLAHLHGGMLNASELGNSLGMSYHTVNRYIDIMEQTFLVRRLRPYFANIGKRLVKSPKIFMRDSGLLHYFLGISSEDDLATSPKRGSSWEGFTIEQIIGWAQQKFIGAEYFYWQTATKQEVDLLIKTGRNLIPIEIKTHTSPRKSDVKGLISCMQDLNLKKGYVVHPKDSCYSLGDGIEVLTLTELFELIG